MAPARPAGLSHRMAAAHDISQKQALAFIFVTVLIDAIGFGIVIPVFPRLIMALTGETVGGAARISWRSLSASPLSRPARLGSCGYRFRLCSLLICAIAQICRVYQKRRTIAPSS